MPYKICSFQVSEYSKVLQAHQLQTLGRYQERRARIKCASRPQEVVCANHIGRSRHNIVAQSFRSQAISEGKVERHAKSMEFRHQIHPT